MHFIWVLLDFFPIVWVPPHIFFIKLMRFLCYILEKKDDFDWGKYLMEGEEIDLGPNVDTPVSGNSFAIVNINICQVIYYFYGSFYPRAA